MNDYSDIDTISLVDIWHLLVKRKMLFWVVFLLIFIFGSVFTVIKAPQYNYTQVLELPGYFEGKDLVGVWPADLAVEKINKFYFPAAVTKYNAANPNEPIFVPLTDNQLHIATVGERYLLFSMKGTKKNQKAYKEVLQMISDDIKTETYNIVENKIHHLEAIVENLQNQKNAIIHSDDLLKNNHDAYGALLLHSGYASALLALDQQIEDLSYKISVSHQVSASELIRSVYPIGPSKIVMLILFGLVGLMFSFFMVFVSEFFGRTKKV